MPTKSTNVTPKDTPPILNLPKYTPNDITAEYNNTICAIEEPSVISFESQFILENILKVNHLNKSFANLNIFFHYRCMNKLKKEGNLKNCYHAFL